MCNDNTCTAHKNICKTIGINVTDLKKIIPLINYN